MTKQKRTFKEWETEMEARVKDTVNATEAVYRVLFTTPLRQTVKEKLVAIEGLNALETQLRGELHRARRKHNERQKTICQACGEYRATWRTWDDVYLCTKCACERHDIVDHTPRCEYCDAPLYGWTDVQRDEQTEKLYCSYRCALKARGCEPMTKEDER